MKKMVLCPSCRRRIFDSDDKVTMETEIVDANNRKRKDFYCKCWNCKKEVGVDVIKKQ